VTNIRLIDLINRFKKTARLEASPAGLFCSVSSQLPYCKHFLIQTAPCQRHQHTVHGTLSHTCGTSCSHAFKHPALNSALSCRTQMHDLWLSSWRTRNTSTSFTRDAGLCFFSGVAFAVPSFSFFSRSLASVCLNESGAGCLPSCTLAIHSLAFYSLVFELWYLKKCLFQFHVSCLMSQVHSRTGSPEGLQYLDGIRPVVPGETE